jgi:hypothetical protein
MFEWTKIDRQRKKIVRGDRRHLEVRERRFLSNCLSATDLQKAHFYEVIAGASAGCEFLVVNCCRATAQDGPDGVS